MKKKPCCPEDVVTWSSVRDVSECIVGVLIGVTVVGLFIYLSYTEVYRRGHWNGFNEGYDKGHDVGVKLGKGLCLQQPSCLRAISPTNVFKPPKWA